MGSKVKHYQSILRQIFEYYNEILTRHPQPDKETVVVIDDDGGHYILHTIGWEEDDRIWDTPLYVRLRDDKIWVEIDWMSDAIVDHLLEAGVPKEDIVLAFHHPSMRPYTEFAPA